MFDDDNLLRFVESLFVNVHNKSLSVLFLASEVKEPLMLLVFCWRLYP